MENILPDRKTRYILSQYAAPHLCCFPVTPRFSTSATVPATFDLQKHHLVIPRYFALPETSCSFTYAMSSDLQRQARWESTFLAPISRQLTKPRAIPQGIRLTDQVAIVTGSNLGLGLEASRQLLQLELTHLVMGVRSEAKGNAAADSLRKEFPKATVSVWLLDMESYDSIRTFANRCASLPRIDISILNAGFTTQKFNIVPATGHETTMQVNYISTALLTILLLPILKAKKNASTRPPVLTLVGSDVTYTAKINTKNASVLKQFDKADSYAQMSWYAASKLFLAFFATKLVDFVDPSDVLINVVSPGMTKGTGFFGDLPFVLGTMLRIMAIFLAQSTEMGATTYIDATIARGPESHGLFLSDWAIKLYVCPSSSLFNSIYQMGGSFTTPPEKRNDHGHHLLRSRAQISRDHLYRGGQRVQRAAVGRNNEGARSRRRIKDIG